MAAKNKKSKYQNHFGEVVASIIVVAVVFCGVLFIINRSEKTQDTDNEKPVEVVTPTDTTDEKEPTKSEPEAEKKDNTEHEAVHDEKDDYESDQTKKDVGYTDSGKKSATVSLNIAQNDKVVILSGRVTNFKEEGGVCSYILTHNGSTQTLKSTVLPDAKYTVCEAFSLEKSNLESGAWEVKLEYKSNYAEGTSEAQTFNI